MATTPEDYLALAEGYNAGDMAWIATATVFCWGIIPGVGLLYSGYTNRKNALSTIYTSLLTLAVGSVSWMTLGYSLTYGVGNAFMGDATLFGHAGVRGELVYAIPEELYSIFQLVFCVATIAVFMGGAAERARLSPLPVLIFLWPLVVYCPVAHWTWASNGWLYTLGAYDFAGGSPVHISSGAGALALSIYMSHPLFRSKKNKTRALEVVERKAENPLQLTLALVLIFGGWLAFDGGSTLALNLRSFQAMYTTQISGSTGAFTWVLLHFIHTGKWTLTGLVSGSICGLVSITPAAGYVGLPASLLFGVAGAGVCFYVDKLRHSALAVRWQILDPAGVFVSHCIGGIVGNCLTGIFAEAKRTLGYQMADCVAVTTYAFVVTYILVGLIDCVPGLEILATEEDIDMGMDMAGCGETFYEETRPFLFPPDTESARSPGRVYRHDSENSSEEKELASGQVIAV